MEIDMSSKSGTGGGRKQGALRHVLAGMFLFAALVAVAPAAIGAADCPARREPRLPPLEPPADNLSRHKKQLKAYHDGAYEEDLRLVYADAHDYVEKRTGDAVKRPAIVLDIDETTLSNWLPTETNDFGYIAGGACSEEPTFSCGFNDWIDRKSAPPIPGALDFFKFAVAKDVAVFFITGRRNSQREATLVNLDRVGFQGWAGLRTRPDGDHNKSVVPFKSGERLKIEGDHYTIIANVGDQDSDLAGGHPDCTFKLPNPFYFIE
jgi:hypothetical protein